MIASVLATLNITKARDADGIEITPVYESTTGMLVYVDYSSLVDTA